MLLARRWSASGWVPTLERGNHHINLFLFSQEALSMQCTMDHIVLNVEDDEKNDGFLFEGIDA